MFRKLKASVAKHKHKSASNTERTPRASQLPTQPQPQPQPQLTRPVPQEKFRYTPLDSPSSNIRLIRISTVTEVSASTGRPLLEVDIFETPIDRTGSYIAISYAWGDPNPIQKILCNGLDLWVPENTFRVLYTIYHSVQADGTNLWTKDETLDLWIDALCINQQDVDEKNSQVPRMGDIYRRAKGAIGYIGAPREGVDPRNAMRSMAWWANCPIITPPADLTRDQSSPDFQSWLSTAQKAGVGEPPATLEQDLTDLWSSPWFTRCWVTQEMVLPRDVVCMYGFGENVCTWDLGSLTMMIDRAQNVKHAHREAYRIGKAFDKQLLQKAIHVDAWRQMRKDFHEKTGQKERDFISLLHRSRRTEATDERDLIYSLFGLMDEQERAAIRVDYSTQHSVADVFLDVARYCIPSRMGPNLLVEAGISRRLPGLPSWVPDWTTMGATPLNTGIYNACYNLFKPIELLSDGQTIKVCGKKVESVASVGIPVNFPYGVLETAGVDRATQPYDLGSIIIAAAVMCEVAQKLSPHYIIRNEDWSEVLRRTCSVDRHWSGRRLRPTDRPEFDVCMMEAGFGDDVFEAIRQNGRKMPKSTSDATSAHANSLPYGILVAEFQKGRVIALLKGGLVACMPRETRVDDIVVILFGGWVPYVLRPLGSGQYELVGHCYVHGIMDGEWIQATLASVTDSAGFAFDEVFDTFHIK